MGYVPILIILPMCHHVKKSPLFPQMINGLFPNITTVSCCPGGVGVDPR